MTWKLACTLGLLSLSWLSSSTPAAGPPPRAVAGPAEALEADRDTSKPAPEAVSAFGTPVPIPNPNDALDQALPTGRFSAGADFLFVQPVFENNLAFTIQRTDTTGASWSSPYSSSSSTREEEFDYGLTFAPRIWLGYTSDYGLGLRTRWWHFNQGASKSLVNGNFVNPTNTSIGNFVNLTNPSISISITSAPSWESGFTISSSKSGISAGEQGTADRLLFENRLQMNVWDVEATQDLEIGPWLLLFTGGGRYAHIAQDYNAFRVGGTGRVGSRPYTEDIIQDTESIWSSHDFHGAGPTASVEARRSLGETGWSFYSSARGSVLFGSGQPRVFSQSVNIRRTYSGSISNQSTSTYRVSSRDEIIPNLEAEIGLEWSSNLGRFRPFLQTALVGQAWFDAGRAKYRYDLVGYNYNYLTFLGANIPSTYIPSSGYWSRVPSPLSEKGYLNFFGLTVTAGIDY